MESIPLDKDKIRDLIGPGGKTIKEICERTQTKIEIDDDGNANIFAPNGEKMEAAKNAVKAICCQPEIGSIYEGTVQKIMDFGAFVSIGGGRDGLVHISKISNEKVKTVADVLKVGQTVQVKVIGIDDRGKIKLTMKDI